MITHFISLLSCDFLYKICNLSSKSMLLKHSDERNWFFLNTRINFQNFWEEKWFVRLNVQFWKAITLNPSISIQMYNFWYIYFNIALNQKFKMFRVSFLLSYLANKNRLTPWKDTVIVWLFLVCSPKFILYLSLPPPQPGGLFHPHQVSD